MTRREALQRIAALNLGTLAWFAGRGRGHCDIGCSNARHAQQVEHKSLSGAADGSSAFVPPDGMQLPRGLRVMVFAPHPDDESLGAGGLLQLIAASRGTSRVVFVTSGDGFVEGARRYFGRSFLVPDDFIDYGRLRCREALDAMKSLGIGRGGIDFLGFPDAGIEALWSAHWRAEHPYVSPHTCMDHPPYPDCRSRECRYTGSSLNRMISDAITGFSPHWVVLPDPKAPTIIALTSSRLAGSSWA